MGSVRRPTEVRAASGTHGPPSIPRPPNSAARPLPEMAGKKYIFPDLQTWLDGGKYWCHTYQGTSFEGPMNGVVQQEDVAAWVEQSREEMGVEGPILGQSDDPVDGDWD